MSTEADIAALHAEYCRMTDRPEPLRFHEASWGIILRQPEYEYDAAKVRDDMKVLVNYLLGQIREDKRNPGALKLRNVLAPDKWAEDLAEAKARVAGKKRVWGSTPANVVEMPVAGDEERRRVAEQLKAFKL
jgi:hypothetical protein